MLTRLAFFTILFFFIVPSFSSVSGAEIAAHSITVDLSPENQTLEAQDIMTCRLSHPQDSLMFFLHGNFTVEVLSPEWKLDDLGAIQKSKMGINSYIIDPKTLVPVKAYLLTPLQEISTRQCDISLRYRGTVKAPLKQQKQEYTRSFQETAGIISTEGVYLSSSSFWYPQGKDEMVSFRLEVTGPANWEIISQGKEVLRQEKQEETRTVVWDCSIPMEEIYIVGGPLVRYEDTQNDVTALVYLHEKDKALAQKYLTATHQYLLMYEQLLGEYPYQKFALVENFWESGYGMPSFTLLGQRIIRFPFILRSSYPHEILHNWWGNGVFVDYEKGNWCEGLTAYLADHLFKEQGGQGHLYRRNVLQKYRDFVRDQEDFALLAFRARHSPATEAVGYGKSLMLFHELRMRVGDRLFIKALRKFFLDHRFQKATFFDIERVFSEVSGQDLKRFFSERVEREGAPQIRVSEISQKKQAGQNKLEFTLEQSGTTDPLEMEIPIAITFSKAEKAQIQKVSLSEKKATVSLDLPEKALRLDIDPYFDLFRRVDRSEIPSSMGQVFGSPRLCVILSSEENKEWIKESERALQAWNRGRVLPIKFIRDNEIDKLPEKASVWLVGKNNRFASSFGPWLKDRGGLISTKKIRIQEKSIDLSENIVVLTAAHPKDEDLALGWIVGGPQEALTHLARKLPHYGKYSYLAFTGTKADNIEKGQWPIVHSQMTHFFTNTLVAPKPFPPRHALAELPSPVNRERLKKHLEYIGDSNKKGRGLGSPELDQVAQYIAEQFQSIGLEPAGDANSFFQSWQVKTGNPLRFMTLKNVVGRLPGSDPKYQDSPVIIAAHYDHLGLGWPDVKANNQGKVHSGADDNASGVSVLLELANIFKSKSVPRPILFISFSGEEAGLLGSRYFVSQWPAKDYSKVLAMINLDTVGRLEKQPLMILGTNSAREWPFLFFGCGAVTNVPVQSVPKTISSSDHVSFQEKGIPSVQIFSGAHIDLHTPQDTTDKISLDGLIKVTLITSEALEYLASRPQPLTSQLSKTNPTPSSPSSKKRASLGSVPDFTYVGKGVRLTGVVPDSPAAKAGLKKGDIIQKVGSFPTDDLAQLAHALREHKVGDKVNVQFQRQNKTLQVEVTLGKR